jgi:chemotaxis protein CheX
MSDMVEHTQPIDAELREQLQEPFISAATGALAEMTGTDLVVHSVYQRAFRDAPGDVSVLVGLTGATLDYLVLSFPKQTATALAGRMLAGATAVDDSLIQDSAGEIANVVAGQAKAMLAHTPHEFSFSIPHVVAGPAEARSLEGRTCLAVAFNSNHGEFGMVLFPKRTRGHLAQP